MNPKALIVTLSVVNLLIGVGLGIALDRTVLPRDQQGEVTKPLATDASQDSQIGDAPKDGQTTQDAPKDAPKDGQTTQDAPGEGRPPRGSHGGRSDWLKRTLDLDDEQTKQVMAIMQARRPKFDAVFQEVRPRLKALEEETHAEILELLRPEQVAKFEELRERFGKRGFRGRRGGRRGSRGWGGRDGRRPERGERGERGERPGQPETGEAGGK